MAFPTTSVLDSFTRTDSSTLGSGWADIIPGWNISGNTARTIQTNNAECHAGWNASTFGPDCEVYATIAAVMTDATSSLGMTLRLTTLVGGTHDGYILDIVGTSSAIYRIDNGAYTQLGAAFTLSPSAGYKYGLEAVGSTLTAYQNTGASWSSVASRTDSTYGSAGYIGMHAYSSAPNEVGKQDDFGGGTVVGGTTYNVIVSIMRKPNLTDIPALTANPVLSLRNSKAIQTIANSVLESSLALMDKRAINAIVNSTLGSVVNFGLIKSITSVSSSAFEATANFGISKSIVTQSEGSSKPIPVWLTGFEYGLATPSINGGGICDALGNAPSIQGTIKHSGSYALKVNQAGANQWIGKNMPASQTILVGRVYFYYETFPTSGDREIFSITTALGNTFYLHYYVTDGVIKFGPNGSVADPSCSVAITTGTWYRLDFRVNVSANPWTGDWQIAVGDGAGTVQTQATRALAASTFSRVVLGSTAAYTQVVYFDDVFISTTSTDYPIGAGSTQGISPGSDGTHNAGTGIIEAQDGTDIGVTTAFDKVNSVPIGDITAYIKQSATGTSNYAEVNFANIAQTNIYGAIALLAYESSSATANEGGCIIIDEDGTQTTVWGDPTTRADYSETAVFYKNKILPVPLGGWDQAAVNALKSRMGYSNNVSSVPWWVDLIIEVAYVPAGASYDDYLSFMRLQSVSSLSSLSFDLNLALGISRDIVIIPSSVLDSVLGLQVIKQQINSVLTTYETSLYLPIAVGFTDLGELTLNGIVTLSAIKGESNVSAFTFNSVVTLQSAKSITDTASLTVDQTVSLSKINNISTTVLATLAPTVAMQRNLNVSMVAANSLLASLGLQKQLSITSLSGLLSEGSISLGRVLAITTVPSLTVDQSITLSKQVSLSNAVNEILFTALALARTLSISTVGASTLDAAVAFLRSVAIRTLQDVGTQTFENVLSLARSLAVSTSTLATLTVNIPLQKQDSITLDAIASLFSALSLSKTVAISTLSGLLISLVMSTLGKIDRITDTASLTVETSIGLNKSQSMEDSNIGTLINQLSMGKTVNISSIATAQFETVASIGRVLSITIDSGFAFDETLSLQILQSLTTISDLIQFLGNLPAKLVIGDHTLWLIQANDKVVPSDIIDVDGNQSDLYIEDTDNV